MGSINSDPERNASIFVLQIFKVPNAWWNLPFTALFYLLSLTDRNTLFCTIALVTVFWTCIALWSKATWEILSPQQLCKRRNNFRQQDVQCAIAVCVWGRSGVYGYKHGGRKFGNFMKQIIWLLLLFKWGNWSTEKLNKLAQSQNFSPCHSQDSNISK